MHLLQATPNRFNGIVIDTEALPDTASGYRNLLERSLATWKEQDYQVVWVDIPLSKSFLIHDTVETGFHFHHK